MLPSFRVHIPSIHILNPLYPFLSLFGLLLVEGGVHPGQVSSMSQGHTLTPTGVKLFFFFKTPTLLAIDYLDQVCLSNKPL